MKNQACNIYIALWCLYYLQGTLYSSGSVISRFLLAVLLIVSLYYFLFANNRYKIPNVLKMLSCLILIWTVYGVIHIIIGDGGRSYIYLKNIYCALLPVFPFYVFARQGQLDESVIRRWGVVFLLIGIAQFYRFRREALAAIAEAGRDSEETTNNMGYVLLSLFPLFPLYYKKPIVQYAIIGVCMIYVLLGMKRGAIIIGIIALLWLLYVQNITYRKSNKQLLRNLLTIVLLVFAVYYIQKLLVFSDYFNVRLEQTLEGDSSGRDRIYGNLLNGYLSETNPFLLMFGNGAVATYRLYGVYAHNDWLEIAINNGFWMIVLYLTYWIIMYRTLRRSKKNTTCYLILSLFFIIYFAKSFVSMSYSSIQIYSTCPLGFALATYLDTGSFTESKENGSFGS